MSKLLSAHRPHVHNSVSPTAAGDDKILALWHPNSAGFTLVQVALEPTNFPKVDSVLSALKLKVGNSLVERKSSVVVFVPDFNC